MRPARNTTASSTSIQVMRDPSHPAKMLEKYDSGDHLHPNDAGYKAMAEAFDVTLLGLQMAGASVR